MERRIKKWKTEGGECFEMEWRLKKKWKIEGGDCKLVEWGIKKEKMENRERRTLIGGMEDKKKKWKIAGGEC